MPSKPVSTAWKCPACRRCFTRKNQRHACGTGDVREVLRNRPEHLVRLYGTLEAFVHTLGPVEVVARQRYVLLRSTRIFTDLVIMTDAVRVAIHLGRALKHPLFFKVVPGDRAITHVAKLHNAQELEAIKPFIQEAYATSLAPKPTA
jgi:hypothetical protein